MIEVDDGAELPGILSDIAVAAGMAAAKKIADTLGGRRCYLRTQALVPIVGATAAERIVRSVGAGLHDVPRWPSQHAEPAETQLNGKSTLATSQKTKSVRRRRLSVGLLRRSALAWGTNIDEAFLRLLRGEQPPL